MSARTAAAASLDALRDTEFARLDASDQVYLDHTGSALYPASLVDSHRRMLLDGVYGNPHSDSPASRLSTQAVEAARLRLLSFLDADPAEYCVVFTPNASGALRLVGAGFPFSKRSAFVLSADNHNSVNGIREYARRAGAAIHHVGLDDELRPLDPGAALDAGARPGRGRAASLFAMPAQSNFSGVQHPLGYPRLARSLGYRVLLDAAAYAPTHRMSVAALHADYIALSFYKIFGYPTGVGALVARREALALLQPPSFAGGTVDFVSVQNDVHRLREGPASMEEGTVSFLDIAAVPAGLDFMRSIDMGRVGTHVLNLTRFALARLAAIAGSVGRVILYGPRSVERRGGTIAFNLEDACGRIVPYERVEAAARRAGISIRGGCFCNPGASEHAFAIPAARARACLLDPVPFSPARLRECLDGRAVGALRMSLGLASNTRDVERLGAFIEEHLRAEARSSRRRSAS